MPPTPRTRHCQSTTRRRRHRPAFVGTRPPVPAMLAAQPLQWAAHFGWDQACCSPACSKALRRAMAGGCDAATRRLGLPATVLIGAAAVLTAVPLGAMPGLKSPGGALDHLNRVPHRPIPPVWLHLPVVIIWFRHQRARARCRSTPGAATRRFLATAHKRASANESCGERCAAAERNASRWAALNDPARIHAPEVLANTAHRPQRQRSWTLGRRRADRNQPGLERTVDPRTRNSSPPGVLLSITL